MVIIKHFIYPDKIELELRTSYQNDGGHSAHQLYKNGFKWNKVRRTWYKCYIDKEYINDRFQEDLTLCKNLFKQFKTESFKLINAEKNY